jgi:hypothetical protein
MDGEVRIVAKPQAQALTFLSLECALICWQSLRKSWMTG